MNKVSQAALVIAVALATSGSARATTGGPNSFEVLGVDSAGGKLFLKESVGGESGEYRLWTYDLKSPAAAPAVTALGRGKSAPGGLQAVSKLALNEVKLTGQITGQTLAPHEEWLLPRYDLKVEAAWKEARAPLELVGWRTPQVRLSETFLLPGGRCALAIVASMGKPEEGGYELSKPALLCSGAPAPLPKVIPPTTRPSKIPGR